MSIKKANLALEYCSVYVSGVIEEFCVPSDNDMNGLIGNEICINISCQYGQDGRTSIILGYFSDVDPGVRPRYDGILKTPMHRVDVCDANNPEIASLPVPGERTRIRVWTNDRIMSDEVIIAVG